MVPQLNTPGSGNVNTTSTTPAPTKDDPPPAYSPEPQIVARVGSEATDDDFVRQFVIIRYRVFD